MELERTVRFRSVLLAAILLLLGARTASGQSNVVAPRITQELDEKKLVALPGNVHPLIHGATDLKAVSDAQPLTRMLLVLKRSAEQESALLRLLEEQHSKSSASYHRWLSPDQFGQQFGPADADIRAVSDWLKSHGFQVNGVAKGRTVIEFSGSAEQVRNALHTEIHRYVVNGEEHLANASDPQIPAALAPVVEGVVSLHNFRPAAHLRHIGSFYRSMTTGEVTPLFTPSGSSTFFPLAPADFAKVYNVAPLLSATPPVDGSGQSIAILGESNIHVQDIVDFRTLFGLPQNFTSSNVIVNGTDPGINGAEGEADLDIQWAGAVAPGATIEFVTSAPTETTSGIHLSAVYAVDNNIAGVLSESFGQCEQNLGTTGNQFYNALWEQAAAQGMTVILSAGDGGSAGCDNFNTQQTAKKGLAVSGFASTPFNVAVGGTDFDQVNNWSHYWNSTNDPVTFASAKGYIPEIPWNDSCAQLGTAGCGTSAPSGSLNIVAGSGGPSTIYAKPAWQSGTGVPADGKRDLPDVSFFASNGFTGSVYIMCEADVTNPPNPSCNLNMMGFTFQGAGGTSASAPAFAGIMALVNQKQASAQNPAPRQGNANYVLYALAKKQAAANLSCNSSTGPDPACTFNDVTKGNSALANSTVGNNAVPCAGGSPNCSSTVSGKNGVLVDPGNSAKPAWQTSAGYDMATGLGSVNAQNLVNNWNSIVVQPSAATLSASVNGAPVSSVSGLVHGQAIGLTSTVAPGAGASGTPGGEVSLLTSPNPSTGSPGSSLGAGVLALVNGTATSSNVILPGGAYSLTAHYPGDGTFGPSDSSPAISVNITAENSKTLISIPVFDASTGKETGNVPSSVVYGTPYLARIDVGNAQAALSFPQQPLCTPPNCPSGTVTWTDVFNGGTPAALDAGSYALNSAGFTEDYVIQLAGGTHQLSAGYSGDSSFKASTGTYSLTITPAPTTTLPGNPPLSSVVSTPFFVNAIVRSQSSGVMPSCNVTVFEGTTALPGTVSCSGQAGGATWGAFLQPSLVVSPTTSGSHTYTVKYNGDANYAASTSDAMTTQVFFGTTATLTVNPATVQYGASITLTAIVDTFMAQGPAIPNKVSFSSGAGPVSGTITYTPITDASGNMALQATLTTTPQYTTYYNVSFAGDSNYASSGAGSVSVTVNIPQFSVTANPASFSVTAGQTGTATISVTPASSAASPVTLSCYKDIIPAGATCSFSPSIVNLSNGNTVSATLTFTTLAPSSSTTVSMAPVEPPAPWPGFTGGQGIRFAGGFAAFLLLLCSWRSRRYRIALRLVSVGLVGLLVGCGGGGGSSPAPASLTATTLSLSTSGIKVSSTMSPTFQVKVNATQAVTGSVTFYDQGSSMGVVNLSSNGTASLQAAGMSIGTHVITASYSGDSKNLPSKTSGALNQVVTGTTPLIILGTTGGLTNQTSLMVTIQ